MDPLQLPPLVNVENSRTRAYATLMSCVVASEPGITRFHRGDASLMADFASRPSASSKSSILPQYKPQPAPAGGRGTRELPSSNIRRRMAAVLFTLFAAALVCRPLSAAPTENVDQSPLNPYPTKPKLTFRPDGTFKITVFSDLHFGENAWDAWGPQQDVNSLSLMRTVLTDEQPDFVVLNGDQITGENTFLENSTVYIDEIIAPLNDYKIPFSSIQGNHDNDVNITHLAEILREQAHAPLSYTRIAPANAGGNNVHSPGTYWVPIFANEDAVQPALILWMFDSRDGRTQGANPQQLDDWVDPAVAAWIENETALMNEIWGPAKNSRGALAFVHIPPYPIQDVWEHLNSTSNPGLNADSLGSGSTQGTTLPGNVEQDEPFWDALNANVQNLHAVISGHDHGDEWCAREPSKDVIFCFAKHSGYGGYSGAGWGHGVRNIVFSSSDPTVGPETWIRLEDGETRAHITLDNNYR